MGFERVRARLVLRCLLVCAVTSGLVSAVAVGAVSSARRTERPVASAAFLGSHRAPVGDRRAVVSASRHVPFARGHAPVVRAGGEVPWLRKADSDTFMAGDGRLVSKIYPVAVNYRVGHGGFAPINPALRRSGAGYVQKANDLGVVVPGLASGRVHLRNRGGAIALSLVGARGQGKVAGTSARFASALPGVALTYASVNTGVQWQAKLSNAGLARGLRWFVSRSAGLSV